MWPADRTVNPVGSGRPAGLVATLTAAGAATVTTGGRHCAARGSSGGARTGARCWGQAAGVAMGADALRARASKPAPLPLLNRRLPPQPRPRQAGPMTAAGAGRLQPQRRQGGHTARRLRPGPLPNWDDLVHRRFGLNHGGHHQPGPPRATTAAVNNVSCFFGQLQTATRRQFNNRARQPTSAELPQTGSSLLGSFFGNGLGNHVLGQGGEA